MDMHDHHPPSPPPAMHAAPHAVPSGAPPAAPHAGLHAGSHAGSPAGLPAAPHEGMHATMSMASPLMDRARAMGSGTALLPATSPMRMWSVEANDWLWMAHGDVVAGALRATGPRGDALTPALASENWQMLMGSRYWGPGILDLRLMTSLEPFTVAAGGTPQLFQAGETWQGRALIDRQHPHDLVMELAGRYTWTLGDQTALFLYGGPAAEPALGPSAFMHRPSAADNHVAPLAHHLQDSTHYTFGAATLGLRQGPFQLEGSFFNGREPDERRIGFDFGPLDSWSTRLSWAPTRNLVAQISYGLLHDPEALSPGDLARTTASLQHVVQRPWGSWSGGLVWGQNQEFHAGGEVLQSYGAEGQLDAGKSHVFGRLELVDKGDLALADGAHGAHRVTALTLGGVRDLDDDPRFDLGLGADATVYSLDDALRGDYGFNPVSARVYLRLRPPTMAPHAMAPDPTDAEPDEEPTDADE